MSVKSGVNIRIAIQEDLPKVLSIWLDGIINSFDPDTISQAELEADFTSNFDQRAGIFNFWVAEDNENNILGWQSLIRTSNNPFRKNNYAESSTYISMDNRYKGLGKDLLQHVINEAENSPLEYIVGFISITNTAALRITKETGWIEVGLIPPSAKSKYKISKLFLVKPL